MSEIRSDPFPLNMGGICSALFPLTCSPHNDGEQDQTTDYVAGEASVFGYVEDTLRNP